MTLFVGVAVAVAVAVAEPVPVPVTATYSKISLSCASKSSLTASYFHLIVSNLLGLHVQLPQTKVAFPTPKYCDTLPSERQRQNIFSHNAVANSTVLCKFHLVLAPKLRNDTSTEQIRTYLSL